MSGLWITRGRSAVLQQGRARGGGGGEGEEGGAGHRLGIAQPKSPEMDPEGSLRFVTSFFPFESAAWVRKVR